MLIETLGTFARRDVLEGALLVVVTALRDQKPISLSSVSTLLLREHPTCQMSLGEIEQELIRMAMDRSVRIVLSKEADGIEA